MAERPGTIYMNDGDRRQMDKVADKLKARGVRSIYKNDGSLNRSALVRFMVDFMDKALDAKRSR